MKVAVKEKFPYAIAGEGTVMDYVDDEFVFIIKDETWTPFECRALQKNQLELDFVMKYDVTIFLLTVLDAIDTSDFIFNLHDGEYPDTILQQACYPISIYLIDQENMVQACKHVTLSKNTTSAIQTVLRKLADTPYQEAEFNCNVDGIQNTWEPFEMQEFAIVKETF